MVRLALGVDFGHGESAGCCVVLRDANGNLVQNSKIEFLNVDNHSPKVYSTLTYENGGNVTIGKIENANVNSYFKRSPKEWDKVDPNSGKNYRTMMKDFIAKLVDGLLNKGVNPTMANYKKDEIVFFVGCPSDETWTSPENRMAYEKLIREATGIENVSVVPESTAAIFSIIHNNPTKPINPKDGVAVFDLGSSTIDFTYIRLGRILAEISWTLGASAIEANIVEKALFDKLKLDPKRVWSGDLNKRQLEARRDFKEAWYGDDINPGHVKTDPDGTSKSIKYYQCDEFGNVVTTKNDDGDDISEVIGASFTLGEKFMESVVKEMPVFEVKEKGKPVDPKDRLSWYEYCKRFFTKCRDFMKYNKKYINLPCKTIILTGGASHMDFVKDICDDVFKDAGVEIYRDESPSYCVCNGLCQIAVNRSRINDVIEHQKTQIRSKADTALAVCKSDIQNNVTEYIYNSIMGILTTLPNEITVSELSNEVTNYFTANFDGQIVINLINEPLQTMNKSVTDSVVEASLEVASEFYDNTTINKNDFSIDTNMTKKIKIDCIKMDKTCLNILARKIAEISNNTISTIIACIVAVILYLIPGVGWMFALLAGNVTELLVRKINNWINNNPDKKIRSVSITNRMMNDAENVKKDIRSSAAKEIADKIVIEQFGNESADFYNAVDEMVDKAVRIVALEYFEETIN